MNVAQIGVACTILLVTTAVIGLIFTVRDRASKLVDAERERNEESFRSGAASKDWLIRQLTTERDDARHDRDKAQASADEGWRRYNDLRDKGTG